MADFSLRCLSTIIDSFNEATLIQSDFVTIQYPTMARIITEAMKGVRDKDYD